MLIQNKAKLAIQAATIFAMAQICTVFVNAQGVITDDAAILPLVGSGQYLTLTNSVNPSEGRYGLFAVQITSDSPSQYTFSYAGIAEGYALYAVNPGVVIDPVFAAVTVPLVSNNGVAPGSSVLTFLLGESRYFGYWDDRWLDSGIAVNTPDVTDNYGWVLITCTESGLQVSSSATALGGGIIAGTLTQVPEPSVDMLFLLGLASSVAFIGFRYYMFSTSQR